MSEARIFMDREPINDSLEIQKDLAKRVRAMSNFSENILLGGIFADEAQLIELQEEALKDGLDLSDQIRASHESSQILRDHLEEFGLEGELIEKFKPIAEKFRGYVADAEGPIVPEVQANEEEINIAKDFILRAENLLLHLTEVEEVERVKLIG